MRLSAYPSRPRRLLPGAGKRICARRSRSFVWTHFDCCMSTVPFEPGDSAQLQARLAGILDVALDCIITIDHLGCVLDFNPAAERTFGYTRAAVLGREMTDLIVPPALRERHRAGLARLAAGGAPHMLGQRIEITAIRADGMEFPVELAITRLGLVGTPVFTAHLRDITDRKRTEAELLTLQRQLEQRVAERTADLDQARRDLEASAARTRESQAYFAASFHASPALMSIASAIDGRLIEMNPAFLAIAGFTREEIIGRTTLQLGVWVRPAQREEFLQRIRTERSIRDFEAEFRAKTGELRYLLLNAQLIELRGEPCMLTVGIDISERRRREKFQAATYQISRVVLAGGDLATLFAELHRIIGGLMPARNFYVALLDASIPQITFPYFEDETIPPPPSRPPGRGITEYVLDTAKPLLASGDELLTLLTERGNYMPIGAPCAQWLGAPLVVEGRAIGVIALQDYRDPRAYTREDRDLLLFVADQAAAAIQRHQVNDALRAAKETADAASRAKSQFLASVSHELRTPLNGILGYAQILRRDPTLTDKQRDGVRVIHESGDHLLSLINDVLDLSKIEAGRIELHPVDFELAEFAAAVGRVFAARAREKNLALELTVAPGLPRFVHGDEQRLRQIVFNLVGNAVKFTTAGRVALTIAPADTAGAVVFSVVDTGPGIAPNDVARLFERFTQVGDRRQAASGTGLGLAISRSLVECLGGRMRVESRVGEGSRFWFEVPLAEATTSVVASSSPASRVTGYDGPRRRVLIVDDIATNRAVLTELLQPLDFPLGEAADGVSALKLARELRPDLVLLDLRMPGELDGLGVARALRADPAQTGLKIVAVSASAYDLDRRECIEAGCDEFLAKPFQEEQLWAVIARVLGLTWRTANAGETTTPFPIAAHPPPPEEADALYELASQGDVVGVRTRAQALLTRDARFALFAQGVLDLAARFKMKAVRQFVAEYRSKP